jgi:hypothetical protein
MIFQPELISAEKKYVWFVLTPICFVGVHILLMLIVFIYEYWCPCHMIFMSLSSNTTGVTSRTGTADPSGAHEFTLVFSGIRVV